MRSRRKKHKAGLGLGVGYYTKAQDFWKRKRGGAGFRVLVHDSGEGARVEVRAFCKHICFMARWKSIPTHQQLYCEPPLPVNEESHLQDQ